MHRRISSSGMSSGEGCIRFMVMTSAWVGWRTLRARRSIRDSGSAVAFRDRSDA